MFSLWFRFLDEFAKESKCDSKKYGICHSKIIIHRATYSGTADVFFRAPWPINRSLYFDFIWHDWHDEKVAAVKKNELWGGSIDHCTVFWEDTCFHLNTIVSEALPERPSSLTFFRLYFLSPSFWLFPNLTSLLNKLFFVVFFNQAYQEIGQIWLNCGAFSLQNKYDASRGAIVAARDDHASVWSMTQVLLLTLLSQASNFPFHLSDWGWTHEVKIVVWLIVQYVGLQLHSKVNRQNEADVNVKFSCQGSNSMFVLPAKHKAHMTTEDFI